MKNDVSGIKIAGGGNMSASAPSYPVGTIAKLLMLTERRVQQLTADGVIPKSERGRYELAPAVQGYIRFLQDRNVGASGGDGTAIDYHVEKARLTKAQADLAELELAKAQGELAPISEFERAQSIAASQIRTNCLNIPQRVVIQLLGETNESVFKEKLRAEIVLALETAATAEALNDDAEE